MGFMQDGNVSVEELKVPIKAMEGDVLQDEPVAVEVSEAQRQRPPAPSNTSVDTCPEAVQCSWGVDDEQPAREECRRLTRQAAGHGGSSILKELRDPIEVATGVPEYIIKVYDESEARNYATLQERRDPIRHFTAFYQGDVWMDEDCKTHSFEKPDREPQETWVRYMRLSNLLKKFTRGPHVMDCKIGVRSFQESEVSNNKLRADLYKKMMNLDPSAPTDEEHEQQAITKHRWMTFNDDLTKMAELGFRIDGIANSGEEGQVAKKELKKATSIKQIADHIMKHFLPRTTGGPSEDSAALRDCRLNVTRDIIRDLEELKTAMRESEFVKSHEFVGCSLLFIADKHGPRGGVYLIDFAKLLPLPEGLECNHLTPWTPGNHEDGLFIGMHTAVATWQEVLCRLLAGDVDVST